MKNIIRRIKYPKLLLLVLTFAAAYIIFSQRELPLLKNSLLQLGYFGAFLAGVFFAYGFTAAPATAALLIIAKQQNIILSGLIAGLGALVSDLLLFKFLRYSFSDEISMLSKEKAVYAVHSRIHPKIKKYLFLIFAGFIIASPLPDEIGVVLLATSRTISLKLFSLLSYILNTAGIFVVLIIGNTI